MTPREFVIWLKGFVQAANNFNLTPKQWDDLREKLGEVQPDEHYKGHQLPSNSSWSNINTGTTDVTHGRPEDSVTYTVEPSI